MTEELSEQLGKDWRVHCDCRAKLTVVPGNGKNGFWMTGATCLRRNPSPSIFETLDITIFELNAI